MNARVVDDVRSFLRENVIETDFILNSVFQVKYLQVYDAALMFIDHLY